MAPDQRPDDLVVAEVLGGNVDAYATLVERYRDSYTRFAVRMLGSHDDADDALQSAFLRGFRNISQCKDPARFGAWLYQIVANECRTYGTRRGKRDRRFSADARDIDRVAQPVSDPDADWREEIQDALNQLDAEQREAFVLKYVEDRSYEEMSEITGAGISALKMRAKRACANLRDLLEGVTHD